MMPAATRPTQRITAVMFTSWRTWELGRCVRRKPSQRSDGALIERAQFYPLPDPPPEGEGVSRTNLPQRGREAQTRSLGFEGLGGRDQPLLPAVDRSPRPGGPGAVGAGVGGVRCD